MSAVPNGFGWMRGSRSAGEHKAPMPICPLPFCDGHLRMVSPPPPHISLFRQVARPFLLALAESLSFPPSPSTADSVLFRAPFNSEPENATGLYPRDPTKMASAEFSTSGPLQTVFFFLLVFRVFFFLILVMPFISDTSPPYVVLLVSFQVCEDLVSGKRMTFHEGSNEKLKPEKLFTRRTNRVQELHNPNFRGQNFAIPWRVWKRTATNKEKTINLFSFLPGGHLYTRCGRLNNETPFIVKRRTYILATR